ncbi:MAG: hypothetical protein K8I82_11525 [Anaerolineae bacterium]|nr:hypothetical protein [Anaerolineae bacterium]
MAEDIILQAVAAVYRRPDTYNVRKGVTASHLIDYGVPYSRSRMYDFLRLLTASGRLQKVGRRGGYAPKVSDLMPAGA